MAQWYLSWLARLRLGDLEPGSEGARRCNEYASLSADKRRLAFADALARILPESRKAPLVLFRLFPLAVQIVTACAFGDGSAASAMRQEQVSILPAIAACRACHGRILERGEPCNACGNPLWKYEWLTAID